MLLKNLISDIDVIKVVGDINVEVNSLVLNSKDATSGSLFFSLKGSNCDGNDYISEAVRNGAVAVITESITNVKITQIIVESVSNVISELSLKFYKPKNERAKVIGIVGTNGKTTTSFILKSILSCSGKNVGVIGTSGIFYGNVVIAPELTTPDAITISKTLMDMANNGVEYAVMELSAHAISQNRAKGITFESLIFTNCTEDHLDYFKNMNDYKQVKKSSFNRKQTKFAVVNSDDDLGLEIIKENKVKTYSYGIYNPSEVFAVNIANKPSGVKFVMNLYDEIYNVCFKYIGQFNVYNCMAASVTAYHLGVSDKDIIKGIETIKGLEGRMEFVENYNGANIYVDYAHTPDGLENTLKALKSITSNRLIVLFGCGGNREKEKRPKMGIIAGKYANFSIITSDNPRFEEPYNIISEIESGLRTKTLNYITIQNRYIATGYGIEMLKAGDVFVLCGKGAEDYQEVMGVKTKYSDKETVKDIISKIGLSGELI